MAPVEVAFFDKCLVNLDLFTLFFVVMQPHAVACQLCRDLAAYEVPWSRSPVSCRLRTHRPAAGATYVCPKPEEVFARERPQARGLLKRVWASLCKACHRDPARVITGVLCGKCLDTMPAGCRVLKVVCECTFHDVDTMCSGCDPSFAARLARVQHVIKVNFLGPARASLARYVDMETACAVLEPLEIHYDRDLPD